MLFVSPSIRLFVKMFKREIDDDDGRILIISYGIFARVLVAWLEDTRTVVFNFIITVVMLIESNDGTVVGSCLDV